MTDQRARAEQVLNQWLDMQPRALRKLPDPFALNALIASALADERRRVLEDVTARIIDTHRMGDRDAWLDLARLLRAKVHAGQEG